MDEPEDAFDDDDERPLDEDERELLAQDLVDVAALKELLGPRGIKGAVFYCPDCNEDHFLAWDLLAGNLKELLDQGESPVHEPAFDPDPNEYVSWDYARGFLDGYESFQAEDLGEAVERLSVALQERGLDVEQIGEVLAVAGLRLDDDDGA